MGKLDDLKRTAGGHVAESASKRDTPVITATTLANLNPARMDGVTRSKSALEIPLDKIDRDPTQPREEFHEESLTRLAESIRARGLLQPIRVRWDEGQGKYILIAGERRWRAAKMAGLSTLTCIVHDGELSPAERLAAQVVENLQREDLRPIERAKAFQTLMEIHGWSGNQLSKELGITQSWVVQSLALLNLPGTVQEQVEQGAIPATVGYMLSTLPTPEDQIAVAEQAVAGKMTRDEVAATVRRRAGRAANKAKGKAKEQGRGGPLTFRIDGLVVEVRRQRGKAPISPDEALAAAEQVAARLRAEMEAAAGDEVQAA